MTKQEFSAFSLPYDVKAIDKFECIWTIHAYKDALDSFKDNEHLSYENFIKEEVHKLILRPLSDLTKEIEHKGEKFVPIIKLMEIAFGVEIDLSRVELSFKDDMYIAKINELEFGFDITDNSLLSFMHNLPSCVPKQLLLFQKLIEWHFNLMDEREEFVDVNTLEENPYYELLDKTRIRKYA